MDFVFRLHGFEFSFIFASCVTLAKLHNLSVAHLQLRLMHSYLIGLLRDLNIQYQ